MLQQALKQVFGFDSLRPGQAQVIEHVMAGESAAAIFPTGSGKSLCYQLPATQLPHLTLVISPLLALMKDQLAFLHSKGIAAASIDSSQDRDSLQRTMQQAREGQLRVLMISVERLKNERFRQFIAQVPISLLVVDEAHCISEWGHNFRPDYLKLPEYRRWLNIPQVLLLTATATPQVIRDMRSKFDIAEQAVTVTGFYRSNLALEVIPCDEQDKQQQLEQLLTADTDAPTILYVTLQKTAESVADRLRRAGLNATAYHAGLDSDRRSSIQQRFMQGEINCIVATIAFGMGIDKADIRRVVHFDMPKSIENYSQEIGRAGRDGQRAECTILANTNGLNTLENFVYGDTPDRDAIAYVVDQVYSNGTQWELMLSQLSRDANIRQLPLKTLLVYLELQQVILPKYSYFADYRFKFIASESAILSHFQGERRAFVEAIFRSASKARTWHSLDFDALWLDYRAERQRVVAAIDYFHEKGWIELQSKQITEVYQVLNTSQDKATLTDTLHTLFARKEQSEIARIHAMVNFFQSSQCLSHTLAGYFADQNVPEQCGHCSVCAGRVAQLHSNPLPAIDPNQLQAWMQPFISACQNEPSVRLISDSSISRFLCGISTPLSSKVKAGKMAGFARLEAYPFAEVNRLVGQLR